MAAWWKRKADEIYGFIPDFGGFLVKANSEGQPGPQDYGRTHADGANVLADAVAPHGGIVMWRAFVYSNEAPDDRAKQAYSEFTPLDGQFRPNVLVQVKNGPIDFQPREPFHPLFGAMPKTPLMMELQITKEYLGFATHLVFLAPLFEEVLRADTHAQGEGSTVAKVIDGTLHGYATTGIAGVANIGTDRNWCGAVFACANWYAFGRLAWDPTLDLARRSPTSGSARTLHERPRASSAPVKAMMLGSREAAVDYMTPLGLHHLMARGHHYGPGPWVSGGPRADWTSRLLPPRRRRGHRLRSHGERQQRGRAVLPAGGRALRAAWDRCPRSTCCGSTTCPGTTAWPRAAPSGRSCVHRYQRGVDAVRAHAGRPGASLEGRIDAERYEQVRAFLAIQEKEARWWRDASRPLLPDVLRPADPGGLRARPSTTSTQYEAIHKRYVPGN